MAMLYIKDAVITSGILKTISEIDEFKGKWQAVQDLAPERLNSLRRIATIESVGSSTRIEGAKLSDKEVAGYADAMDVIFESCN